MRSWNFEGSFSSTIWYAFNCVVDFFTRIRSGTTLTGWLAFCVLVGCSGCVFV